MNYISLEKYLSEYYVSVAALGFSEFYSQEKDENKVKFIAEILYKTGSTDYASYINNSYELEDIQGLNILIVDSCYLIFSFKESSETLKHFVNSNFKYMSPEALKLLRENDKYIYIETIYSSKEGKGDAQKAISELKKLKEPIITDTFTAQLAHLCKKNDIPLLKTRTKEDLEYKYFYPSLFKNKKQRIFEV